MNDVAQRVLADAYDHNSIKAYFWIGWVLVVCIILWFFKNKPRL